LGGYALGAAVSVLSFIGGIGVAAGLFLAAWRGYLRRRPWVIHFENRSEKKPVRSDKLRLYPGQNRVFVQVLAKVPLDYSLAMVRIALKPRRKKLSALVSYISLYKKGVYKNYGRRALVKAWFRGSARNPSPDFFVRLAKVWDRSPLREELGSNFIAEPSWETGITWFVAYNPPYKIPAGYPVWLYLDIEVGALPRRTADFDERREALGIEFTSGVGGQRRPIFREIRLMDSLV
jgi:hypothetical protein